MSSARDMLNGVMGAWRLLKRDESAQTFFDLSADGMLRSFTALLLSLPILFFTATAFWRIAQTELDTDIDVTFGRFIAVEMASTVIYWGAFLLAMQRISQAMELGVHFGAYLVTYNWGVLLTSILFALPLVPYSLQLIPAGAAVVLVVPAIAALGWYRWQIARVVLGAEPPAAAAILVFDIVLSLSIDQLLGMVFLSGGGGLS